MFAASLDYTPLDLLWGNDFQVSENSVSKRKRAAKDPVCQLYNSQFNNDSTRVLIDNAIADYSAYYPFDAAGMPLPASAPMKPVMEDDGGGCSNSSSSRATGNVVNSNVAANGSVKANTCMVEANVAPVAVASSPPQLPTVVSATPLSQVPHALKTCPAVSNVATVSNGNVAHQQATTMDAMYAPERERPLRSQVVELMLYVMSGLLLIIVMDIMLRMGFRAHLSNSGL